MFQQLELSKKKSKLTFNFTHFLGTTCLASFLVFYIFNLYFQPLMPYFLSFRQVRTCLILELHEITRMLHIVAFPMVFIQLCDVGQHGRLLKLMKNVNFKYCRPLWLVYSRFCAGPGAYLELYKNDENMFYIAA